MRKPVPAGREQPSSRRFMFGVAVASGAMAVSLAVAVDPAAAQSAPAPDTKKAEAQKPAKKDGAAKAAKPAAASTKADKTANAKGGTASKPAAGSATAAPAGTAKTEAAAAPAGATAGVASATIQDVVVTSRLREENLQDVPVPVTAVSGEDLDKQHQSTVRDFAQRSPSLTVNASNARQTSIAVRGVGKNIANEALEASVGVIVDGVFVALPGMTWGDYADLERIELIRGPQGTLLGKNTTLGVLNVVTKPPSFTPENEVEFTYGNRQLFVTKGSSTGTLIDNKLAYRASIYYDNQDPWLANSADPSGSADVNGIANRWGGRLQFLYTPTANITNRTIIDHSYSNERNTATVKVSDPQFFSDNGLPRPTTSPAGTFSSRLATLAPGYTPIFDPFNSVDLDQQKPTLVKQDGISTQTDWTTDGGYVVTSISAYKDYHFDALNDVDYTRFPITQGGYLVDSWQGSQELRLTSPKNQEILGQKFDWQGGLYALHTESVSIQRSNFGALAGQFYANSNNPLVNLALADVSIRQRETPVTTSVAAYGQTTWHATERADLTLGLRNTFEKKTNWTSKFRFGGTDLSGPLAALAPLKESVAQTFLLDPTGSGKRLEGEDINANSWSWLINPSYKLNENTLLYASYSHGEKSGAVQFDTETGSPLNVDPEVVEDYEIGIKAALLDRTLLVSANLYWTDIEDYQAVLAKPSIKNPAIWATYLGNIPGVRLRGVEAEGTYRTPIEGLNVSFGGSYNDGIYSNYARGQCPADLSYGGQVGTYCDYTGKTFAGVSKWVGNIGVDYSHQVFSGYTGYIFAANQYRSRVNYGVSELSIQDGYSVTNAGIGIHPNDENWDLSLWGKNIFDTQYYSFLGSYSAVSPVVGMPGDPLQFGVTYRKKL